jgi:hypothetical protein
VSAATIAAHTSDWFAAASAAAAATFIGPNLAACARLCTPVAARCQLQLFIYSQRSSCVPAKRSFGALQWYMPELQPDVASKLLVTAATRQHTAAVLHMLGVRPMRQQIDAATLGAMIRKLFAHPMY